MSRTLEILEKLIAFPSVSVESNLPIIAFIEAFLAGCGAVTHRLSDETGQKAGLFARIGPADGAGVMLSGHTDVVPVTGQDWSVDPFRLTARGGRVYGRGTTDMKGFLAAMLSLSERAAKQPLKQPLKLAFSWDEELGCLGIPQMLPALVGTIGPPALCIVGEPTLMTLALGHKGKVALRAICHGIAGHSAMAPDFLNAIHLATDFVAELRGIQADLATNGVRDTDYGIPYTTLHVGKIAGGTALNIVPDRAVVDFEFRFPANQPESAIQTAIAEAATRVAARYHADHATARIELSQVNAYPGLATRPDAPAVALLRRLVPGAAAAKVAFGTEAGFFDAAGVPTIVCGPGSMDQGHKPDEYIELSELAACDRMCDRLLQHLLV